MSAFEGFLFYAFGALLLGSGLGVIFLRNPVHCALLLVLSFVAAAVLWLLLGAEFLAWVLILVYVGAVMVLFLFVVMMLDLNLDRLREGFWRYLPVGVGVILVLGGQLMAIFATGVFEAEPKSARVAEDYSSAKELGAVLYTDYLLAFEIAAAILLVAIVAAIALTMRRRPENKQIEPDRQVAVKAADRLRMEQISVAPPPAPAPQEEGEDKPAPAENKQ
ncbi:MAG: NADH-quinone oxidoreductase subunit J [Betaproteobacteria bacterium AqS2]|uniref:NADH-quinone oxidoreductase subunit J n=1 Tax=Candidatus Amphirhobacter heronislandensis TaxID=1732024 RepID=A0A930Y1F1_9GAMM|nr:NADH-quinone oxidoreductase subunit J [Betaproteobacteria bacterium AqS2]